MGPWDYVEGGDAEAAVIDIILSTPEFAAAYPDAIVSSDMIGYTSEQRRVVVSQEGAFESFLHIEHPRIDFEVYAERRAVAFDMAKICLASVKYQAGRYVGNGIRLTDCRVEQGLTKVPDKYSESDRYIFSVRLTCVPGTDIAPAT